MDMTAEDLLLTKSPEWSYEAEWRMLVPLKDANRVVSSADDTIYLFTIPLSAITAVILGGRSSAELRDRVNAAISAAQARHIRVKVASLNRDLKLITVRDSS
jgi:hypothetical protein